METIGWLVGGTRVYCDDCYNSELASGADTYVTRSSLCKIFRVNIGSYGQRCFRCLSELVKASTGWPELFSIGDIGNDASIDAAILNICRDLERQSWSTLSYIEARDRVSREWLRRGFPTEASLGKLTNRTLAAFLKGR